jgi:hypothetical protein
MDGHAPAAPAPDVPEVPPTPRGPVVLPGGWRAPGTTGGLVRASRKAMASRVNSRSRLSATTCTKKDGVGQAMGNQDLPLYAGKHQEHNMLQGLQSLCLLQLSALFTLLNTVHPQSA